MTIGNICHQEGKETKYTIIKIDKTDNATWITVQDAKENTLAYGLKAFKAKYIIDKGKT